MTYTVHSKLKPILYDMCFCLVFWLGTHSLLWKQFRIQRHNFYHLLNSTGRDHEIWLKHCTLFNWDRYCVQVSLHQFLSLYLFCNYLSQTLHFRQTSLWAQFPREDPRCEVRWICCLTSQLTTRGFKSRNYPPYPQRVARRLNGSDSLDNRQKKGWPRVVAWTGTLKSPREGPRG